MFPLAVPPFGQMFVSRSSVRKFSLPVYPFNLIRLKILISCSSIRPYPFENFNKPFIGSTSSLRKILISHLSVRPHPFENFNKLFICSRYPFRTACLAIRHPFACRSVQRSNSYHWERFRMRGHIFPLVPEQLEINQLQQNTLCCYTMKCLISIYSVNKSECM